jgi:hypothetical protein
LTLHAVAASATLLAALTGQRGRELRSALTTAAFSAEALAYANSTIVTTVFLIGSADNAGWDGPGPCIGRVDADEMPSPTSSLPRTRIEPVSVAQSWTLFGR